MSAHIARLPLLAAALTLALAGCTTVETSPSGPPVLAPDPVITPDPVKPITPPRVAIPQKTVPAGESPLMHAQPDQPLYQAPAK